MTDISLKLAMEYLLNLSISQIEIKDHYLVRSRERKIPDKWIIDCLIDKEPLEIIKQSDDKFRIYYEHPEKPEENDLIIVASINYSTQHITTFNQSIVKMVRIHGQD